MNDNNKVACCQRGEEGVAVILHATHTHAHEVVRGNSEVALCQNGTEIAVMHVTKAQAHCPVISQVHRVHSHCIHNYHCHFCSPKFMGAVL